MIQKTFANYFSIYIKIFLPKKSFFLKLKEFQVSRKIQFIQCMYMDFMITAEFTQIVWNDTQAMGISMLREEGFYKILIFYNPPGNIEGKFKLNVFMPRRMELGESSSNYNN